MTEQPGRGPSQDFTVYALTDQQRAAMRQLWRHPLFDARPCVIDPQSWDPPTRYRVKAWRAADRDRAEYSAHLCRTACPVLAECDAVRRSGAAPAGVVAGRVLGEQSAEEQVA